MKRLIALVLVALTILSLAFTASASSVNISTSSSIEDDLKGVELSKIFDIDDLKAGFSTYFVECGYGSLNDYALYLYIYNINNAVIREKSSLNKVQMSLTKDGRGNPIDFKQYPLLFCSKTDDNLVYKYKIDGVDASALSADLREYFISSVELHADHKIKDVRVGHKYEFKGFAKDDTFEGKITYFEVLELDVAHTYFRLGADSEYSFYDLQSVYFNVPDNLIEEYGNIYSLLAKWKECFTTPILITNDKTVYSKTCNILRKPCSETSNYPLFITYGSTFDMYNNLFAPFSSSLLGKIVTGSTVSYIVDGGYFKPKGFEFDGWFSPDIDYSSSERLDALNYCFLASREDINTPQEIEGLSDDIRKYLDANNWDDSLFSFVNSDNYDAPVLLRTDALKSITEYQYEGNWLDKLLGKGEYSSNSISYNPIVSVDSADKSLSTYDFSQKYLCAENDVSNIQAQMKNGETTYLLRYTVTPYVAFGDDDVAIYREESEYVPINNDTSSHEFGDGDIDAMIVQTTAIKGFDMIEVTFDKEGEYTTLAVVQDPTDYVTPVDGVEGNDEGDGEPNWWMIIVALFCVIIVLLFLVPFFPYIVSFISKLVSLFIQLLLLPFKVVANLIKNKKNGGK